MKRITAIIIAFFILETGYGQTEIDVLHYKFNIEVNDNDDTIQGLAEITFKVIQKSSSFSLDLALQRARGKGMIIDNISFNGFPIKNFSQSHDKIVVAVPPGKNTTELPEHDSSVLIVSYHGVPADGLIISKNKYGDRTFFSDNWPDRAHNWIPCKDDPADKARFEFIVTAPSQYQVVSNGTLEEIKNLPGNRKLTHWKEDVPLPTKVMVIGIAKFAVKKFPDSPSDIPVSAWVYPQDSVSGFRNYSTAPAILKFYSDYVGPFPYNKLANVQSTTIFGGMENASAIFYSEESAEQNASFEDLLAHEIAHQWFGDMVTEKSFSHLWLSEGFANYMTDIYLGYRYGADSMVNRLKEERARVIDFQRASTKPVVDSASPFMRLLSPNSYERGAWVLHMLHMQLGDSIFRNFIRAFYDRYKGKNADTDDLRKVAEQLSGKDLRQFFRQWLHTPAIPRVHIRWHYDQKNRAVSITIDQKQKQGVFQFPLEIKLISDKKSAITTLNITRQRETFSVPARSVISDIDPDPNTSLLFEQVKY